MTAERWQRIQSIFHRALELPAGQRAAYLDEACAGDAALREELELLLASDEEDTVIRNAIQQEAAELAYGERSVPRQIGPYRLLRELGSGGMGTVWLAERTDDEFQQRVAIKLVTDSSTKRELLQRFRSERQILANLEHPNIARLLDGGTEGNLPYVVMEYVDGAPITDFCAQRKLSIPERLKLFRKACSAVEFAHQNLVVHRDIKPANLLVTAAGEPKLLDFGIAKLLDPDAARALRAVETMAAARMMTPAYASPEQVKGKTITTATDVYSLGVLLFELLTNARPFQSTESESYQLQKAICEDPPPAPSSLRPGISRDLDAIVRKAMRKEPGERYASVERLSEDIRRYLTQYPVRAREGDWQYRTVRFFQRHKAVAPVSAAFLVVIALAIFGVTREAQRTAEQRDRALAAQTAADRARQNAESQRQQAEQNLGIAEQQRLRAEEAEARASAEAARALEEAETARQVADFLEGLFRDADPSRTSRADLSAKEMLERGSARMQQELAGEPVIQGRLGEIIGQAYTELSEYERAQKTLEESLAVRKATLGADHPETARTMVRLGAVHRIRGELEKSQEYLDRALAIQRRHFGKESEPVARTLLEMGEMLISRSRHEEARAALREANAIFRRTAGGTGDGLRESLRLLAAAEIRAGKPAEAVELLHPAIASARKQHGEEHIEVARYLNPLGLALRLNGRLDEAESVLRESHDIYVKVLGPQHPSVGSNLSNRGAIAYARGRYPRAAEFFEQSLGIYEGIHGRNHPIVARLLNNLAVIRFQTRDYQQALTLYSEILRIAEETLGRESVDYADSLNNLGRVYLALRQFPKAEQTLLEALELRKRVQGERHPSVAVALDGFAIYQRERGSFAEAEALHRQSLSIRREVLRAGHPGISVPLLGIGICRLAQGDPQGAEALLREGLDIRRKALPAGHWEVAEMESALGAALMRQGKRQQAETLLQAAHAVLLKTQGQESAVTQQAQDWLKELQGSNETLRGDARQSVAP